MKYHNTEDTHELVMQPVEDGMVDSIERVRNPHNTGLNENDDRKRFYSWTGPEKEMRQLVRQLEARVGGEYELAIFEISHKKVWSTKIVEDDNREKARRERKLRATLIWQEIIAASVGEPVCGVDGSVIALRFADLDHRLGEAYSDGKYPPSRSVYVYAPGHEPKQAKRKIEK